MIARSPLPSSRVPTSPRFRIGVLASLVVLASTVPAAAQGSLWGTITNAATGATLEGARVTLKGQGLEVHTDWQGVYRFDDAPAGNAVIVVTYTGLSPSEASVAIAPTGRTRKDVGLSADIYRLSSFVVGSEREGNAKAITLQRLSDGVKSIVSTDAFGGLAGNPADLAMRLPGVEGESVGGDMRYLRIRGLHQNLSSITQDGTRTLSQL